MHVYTGQLQIDVESVKNSCVGSRSLLPLSAAPRYCRNIVKPKLEKGIAESKMVNARRKVLWKWIENLASILQFINAPSVEIFTFGCQNCVHFKIRHDVSVIAVNCKIFTHYELMVW